MRTRWMVASLVVLLALLGVWWSLGRGGGGVGAVEPLAREPAEVASERLESVAPLAPEPERTRTEAPAAPQPAPEQDVVAPRRRNLDERGSLTFLVVDPRGVPIAHAEISLTGTRTKRERGSHYGWRIDEQLGATGADGRLTLEFPVWTTKDDDTGEVSFRVTHPSFATAEGDARIDQAEAKIVLAPGSVLVVSGWIGSPENVVTAVRPRLSWEVDIEPRDWLPRRDGRLTTTRVPAGVHLVQLVHETEGSRRLLSAMTEFVLVEGEEKELHLELFEPRSLSGRLDDEVPRPVIDGKVVVMLQKLADGGRGGLYQSHTIDVRPDGTFSAGGLAREDAQYVAICRGWSSPLVREVRDAGTGVEYEDEISPRLDLRGAESEFVIDMQPTATLSVTLSFPDGTPLEGARIDCWPNACWLVGACGIFADGWEWSASTDANGIALVPDIPAGEHGFSVTHPRFDLPFDPPGDPNARRHRSVRFESGKTFAFASAVEPADGR